MSQSENEEVETDDFESILEQVQEEYQDDSSESDFEDEDSYEEDDSEGDEDVEESEDDYSSEDEEAYAEEEDDLDDDYDSDTEEEPEQEETSEVEQEEEPEVQQEEEPEGVSELEQLRNMVYQQQQLLNQFQLEKDSLKGKREEPQAQNVDPRVMEEQRQLENAFRLQLFGTAADKEEYESLPKPVKDRAQEALKIHAREESLNILYPERAYENKIKFFVQRDIKEALGEIMQERQTQKAKSLFSKYEDVITTPEQKQRLLKEIRSIPGYKSKDMSVQARVLDTAVDRVLREDKLSNLAQRERDLELREAQLRRSQEARKVSATGKRGRRRSRAKQQQLKSGDDLLSFARSLEREIRNGR